MLLVLSNFCATVADSRPLHLCSYQDHSVAWEVFENTRPSQAQPVSSKSCLKDLVNKNYVILSNNI